MHRKFAVPFLTAASIAQSAEVAGYIYDPLSATVPKAQVVLRHQEKSTEFTVTSGPAGEFRLENLPAGNYELEVLMPGFARFERREIKLNQTSSTSVSANLKLGEVWETVEVTARGQAPPQQRPPQRVLAGGYLEPLQLLKRVNVAYPVTARTDRREGSVTLKAVVGIDGTIVSVTVSPGADADLGAAAEHAIRQWVYAPTLLNGKPVETVTTVQVNFRLGV